MILNKVHLHQLNQHLHLLLWHLVIIDLTFKLLSSHILILLPLFILFIR